MLARDRFVRGAALLLAALCLPLFVPILPRPLVLPYERIAASALAVLTISACLYWLGAVRSPVEKRFWALFATATAAALLAAAADGFGLRALRDSFDGGALLLLAVAIELRPHASELPGGISAARPPAAALFTLTLFACWIAIPWSARDPEYDPESLRLTFLIVLHVYLALRLLAVRGSSSDVTWRAVYGWLVTAFALLALGDAARVLARSGALPEIPRNEALDLFQDFSFAAVLVAARAREWKPTGVAAEAPGAPERFQALPAGLPLLLAAALGAIHLVPEVLGLRPPRFHRWQELVLLIGFLGLAALARAHQMRLDRQNRRLADAQRRAEIDVRESREAALDASRARSRFLATVSHEMRTPLNAIIGMLELALRGEPEGERREYLRTARLSGDQLLQLINDQLDLAKIESGTLALKARPFSLSVLLEACIDSLRPRAREKRLDLSFEIGEGPPTGCAATPRACARSCSTSWTTPSSSPTRGESASL